MESLDVLKLIKEKMKSHDWFYDYNDDMRHWRKGHAEYSEILKLLVKIPLVMIKDLKELVPEELHKKWDGDIARLMEVIGGNKK